MSSNRLVLVIAMMVTCTAPLAPAATIFLDASTQVVPIGFDRDATNGITYDSLPPPPTTAVR